MKKLLSNILAIVCLFAVSISASSFSILHERDSLKNPESGETIPNDEIANVRISTPSAQTIKKADLEIHKSMAEYILKLKSFKVTGFDSKQADLELNSQFKLENTLKLNETSQYSDNEINKWFYLNSYFSQLSSNFSLSDRIINSRFESEF